MKFVPRLLVVGACGLLAVACSSSDAPGPTGAVGGPVIGATDAHCAGRPVVSVNPEYCHGGTPEEEGEGGAANAGDDADAAGGSDCNQTHDAEYGDTLLNSEGDDDDCKYHVSWTSTPIRLDQNVIFTVTTRDIANAQPLESLPGESKLPLTRVEVYQPCQPNRLGPTENFNAEFEETAPGVFEGGPIRFDRSGRWVVRFHFYEECNDGEESPHGHVAFFVDVP